MSQQSGQRRFNCDKTGWPLGVDSQNSPLFVKDGYVRWLENAVTKGGVIQTRPGMVTRYLFDYKTAGTPENLWWVGAGSPAIIAQGMAWFQPTLDGNFLVFSVSGSVWQIQIGANGVLSRPAMIAGVSFGATSLQVVFTRTVQTQDIVNGLSVSVDARNLLMMQDGNSRACYWDGTLGGQLNPNVKIVVDSEGDTTYPSAYNQTRIGQFMAWSGNRLFVANGSRIYASDFGDPTHFTEMLVLLSTPVINMPSPVTGMIDRGTTGVTNAYLVVAMADVTWAIQSGVAIRVQSNGNPGWVGTPNFATQIFAGTGCVAGKTMVNHWGLLYWMSAAGVVLFDTVNAVTSTQNLPAIDNKMGFSKQLMGTDRSLACAGTADSYVFWSVPVGPCLGGRQLNGHTQVLDRQTTEQLSMGIYGPFTYGTSAWQGVWTGINPVEWASVPGNAIARSFALSLDQDGKVRIWEAFQGNRSDNGAAIPWTVETPLHAPANRSLFDYSNFLYARFYVEQMIGNLAVELSFKGTRGQWKPLMTRTFNATPGPYFVGGTPYATVPTEPGGPLESDFQPQVRDVLTKNVRGAHPECQSSAVECFGKFAGLSCPDDTDRAFSLLFQMAGVGAISAFRIASDDADQAPDGSDIEQETGFHILPTDGCPMLLESSAVDANGCATVPPFPNLQPDSNQLAFVAFRAQPYPVNPYATSAFPANVSAPYMAPATVPDID